MTDEQIERLAKEAILYQIGYVEDVSRDSDFTEDVLLDSIDYFSVIKMLSEWLKMNIEDLNGVNNINEVIYVYNAKIDADRGGINWNFLRNSPPSYFGE